MSNFFATLPGFRDFADLTQDRHYSTAPDDWSVVITDIEGSTKAIQNGRYKAVNMVGASTIAAVVNATGIWELPFVFGGDGSTALIPNSAAEKVKAALARSKEISERQHGLKLRIGLVPHHDLLKAGAPVRIAKYVLSESNALAFFKGTGLSLAEKWVKEGKYLLDSAAAETPADPHEGLSCRWAPLRSQRGIFLSILIKAHDHSDTFMQRLLHDLDHILDFDSPDTNPVKAKALRPESVYKAAKLESTNAAAFLKNVGFVYFVKLLNAGLLKVKTFDMAAYKNSLAPNSDFRKFDETIRMVVDCTPEMKDHVVALLEGYHRQGKISYGVHPSDTALMTCFVRNYQDKHVHFIDGGDGGYAFAARGLKEQLKNQN